MVRRGITFDTVAFGQRRGDETSQHYASYQRNAEIHGQARGQHGVLQAVGQWRDKRQRGHRHGIEIVGAEVAGGEPAGRNQCAHGKASADLGGVAAERRIGERKHQQRHGNDQCGHQMRDRLAETCMFDHRRNRIERGRRLRPLQQGNAQRREQALERHLRRHGNDHHHHQRTQVAAPEQHQRARGAAIGQDHAVAEQRTAEEHQRGGELRLQINRLGEIDKTGRRQQLGRQNGQRHRQREAADPAPVMVLQPVPDTAVQTKAGQQPD